MKTKQMKPSEAMLRGFAMAGGKQCREDYFLGDQYKPTAVCAVGAFQLGMHGDAKCSIGVDKICAVFFTTTGMGMHVANDDGMSIPDIAGILASEGY